MIVVGLLLCTLATIVLYYQAGLIPLDDWFNVVAEKGDEVFHWGNITFDSIVEKVEAGLGCKRQIPEYLVASDSTRDYWAIAAYIMTAFTVILLFVVIALGHAVNVSIEMMKHATLALMKIPSILTSEPRSILRCRVPVFITIVNLVVFIFIAWSYLLTLSSNLSLTDYTNQVMSVIGDYLRMPLSSLYLTHSLQFNIDDL